MDVKTFIRQRPCLDEIDGFLFGRFISDKPLTSDELAQIVAWQRQLLAGKDVPARMKGGAWVYRKGRKPEKVTKKAPPPASNEGTPLTDVIDDA